MQLQAAGLLEGERATAAHRAPGNAFERVYGKVAGRVRARVEAADPVLAQWIQARRRAPASAAAATVLMHAEGPWAWRGYSCMGQVQMICRRMPGLMQAVWPPGRCLSAVCQHCAAGLSMWCDPNA